MRAIIVEDEYYTARTLQGLLQKLEPNIEVLQVLQSVEECVEWFGANSQPDLAFMDILFLIVYRLLAPLSLPPLMKSMH